MYEENVGRGDRAVLFTLIFKRHDAEGPISRSLAKLGLTGIKKSAL